MFQLGGLGALVDGGGGIHGLDHPAVFLVGGGGCGSRCIGHRIHGPGIAFALPAFLDAALHIGLGRQGVALQQRVQRCQAPGLVVPLGALTPRRILVHVGAHQGVGLLEGGAQRRIGQALFHGGFAAARAQVAAGFVHDELQVRPGVFPVQFLGHGLGCLGLAGPEALPGPQCHAHQHEQGEHQQHHAHHLHQQVLDPAQHVCNHRNPRLVRKKGRVRPACRPVLLLLI